MNIIQSPITINRQTINVTSSFLCDTTRCTLRTTEAKVIYSHTATSPGVRTVTSETNGYIFYSLFAINLAIKLS